MPLSVDLRRPFWRAMLVCVLAAPPLHAQRESAPVYGVSLSAGWHQPVANRSEETADRTLVLLGIDRRFVLAHGRFGTLSFAPVLLPAVSAAHNRKVENLPCPVGSNCNRSTSYSAFGAGALPVAVRLQTSTERRLSLTGGIDGGGVWFNQRIPTPQGARFNVIARGNVGVGARLTDNAWLSVGYSRLHLSNGGRGENDPGIDADLLTLGTSWR